MTPGAAVDAEAARVFRAGGQLAAMVVKRRISRSVLLATADELRTASDNLRRIAANEE